MADKPNTTVQERVEEAMREIGVLLTVLSPLDVVVDSTRKSLYPLLSFTVFGIVFFGVAVAMERRRKRA